MDQVERGQVLNISKDLHSVTLMKLIRVVALIVDVVPYDLGETGSMIPIGGHASATEQVK
jgi:hypothetical protein